MSAETQPLLPGRIDEDAIHHLKLKPPDLLPARMLNEFVYCPRLFFYEWVEGVFESSADTLDGKAKHTRVDSGPSAMPTAEELDGESIHSRSVTLTSERVGLTAKLDLIENDSDAADANSVRPVDYKRGKPHDVDGVPMPWPSDRVQIAAQALVLRDNGYRCDEGILYYSGTKQRVRIAIDDALIAETEDLTAQARKAAVSTRIPDPLADSPKCPRCSLVGICLPDETNALRTRALRFEERSPVQISLFESGSEPEAPEVRQLVAARDDLRPLYLNSQGFRVGKSGEVIQVKDKDALKQEIRLPRVLAYAVSAKEQPRADLVHRAGNHSWLQRVPHPCLIAECAPAHFGNEQGVLLVASQPAKFFGNAAQYAACARLQCVFQLVPHFAHPQICLVHHYAAVHDEKDPSRRILAVRGEREERDIDAGGFAACGGQIDYLHVLPTFLADFFSQGLLPWKRRMVVQNCEEFPEVARLNFSHGAPPRTETRGATVRIRGNVRAPRAEGLPLWRGTAPRDGLDSGTASRHLQ